MPKRLIAVFLIAAVMLCSCSSLNFNLNSNASDTEQESETKPHTKEDGDPYTIGYVDYDNYAPASVQLFYILKGLEGYGWIKKKSIPVTLDEINSENLSTEDIYNKLITADLGKYIRFAKDAFWYLGYEDNEVVKQQIRQKAAGELDMLFTFGTSAGLFVKNLSLSIPMVDFSATDPVTSGIIDSATEGTGNRYVWAQVEPSIVRRQVSYYYYIKPFEKLGVIAYADEVMSGVPDIYRLSSEYGFDIEYDFIIEQKRETDEEWESYYNLVYEKINEMANKDIDAFFLPVDVIWDSERLSGLIEPLYQKDIPVYIMDGPEFVENGGVMLISANDMDGIGDFVANAVIRILNGENPSEIPCIYKSAPAIYFNYKVAERIGYPLTFDFLVSCDKIYSSESIE